jgi:hypothetical protein
VAIYFSPAPACPTAQAAPRIVKYVKMVCSKAAAHINIQVAKFWERHVQQPHYRQQSQMVTRKLFMRKVLVDATLLLYNAQMASGSIHQ